VWAAANLGDEVSFPKRTCRGESKSWTKRSAEIVAFPADMQAGFLRLAEHGEVERAACETLGRKAVGLTDLPGRNSSGAVAAVPAFVKKTRKTCGSSKLQPHTHDDNGRISIFSQ
jgi:hypothetical protein